MRESFCDLITHSHDSPVRHQHDGRCGAEREGNESVALIFSPHRGSKSICPWGVDNAFCVHTDTVIIVDQVVTKVVKTGKAVGALEIAFLSVKATVLGISLFHPQRYHHLTTSTSSRPSYSPSDHVTTAPGG